MLRRNSRLALIAFAATLFVAAPSWALSSYSEDFEGLDQANPDALNQAGWLVFGNVFDPNGGYLYGYGVFPAPNGGNGFSSVAAGEGGPAQGAQQLVVFSDYNNGDHANGNRIEANVFQQQDIVAGDVGETYQFTFDAKIGNLEGDTTALAFIKTLDPNAGFATTNFVTVDMTSIPDSWGVYSLSLIIDPSLAGQILQFGFLSNATLYAGSGVYYDNITFAPSAVPLPGALVMLASGFAGLLGFRRKR